MVVKEHCRYTQLIEISPLIRFLDLPFLLVWLSFVIYDWSSVYFITVNHTYLTKFLSNLRNVSMARFLSIVCNDNVPFQPFLIKHCISAMSWGSVLLKEETGVPAENHRLATRLWQTLSHNANSLNCQMICQNFFNYISWERARESERDRERDSFAKVIRDSYI
jgi:hypothetical protein